MAGFRREFTVESRIHPFITNLYSLQAMKQNKKRLQWNEVACISPYRHPFYG